MTNECIGCGVSCPINTVLWYGRWRLCVECKARSVITGWLPLDATPADYTVLAADVLKLARAHPIS